LIRKEEIHTLSLFALTTSLSLEIRTESEESVGRFEGEPKLVL
jgi:hypothetical protein